MDDDGEESAPEQDSDAERMSDRTASEVPDSGRLLGVDFGTKRIGLSICNPDQSIASPLETLQRQNPDQDARRLRQILDEYRVVGIVIGLPVHLSGEESRISKKTREWGAWAESTFGLPVVYADERFSSSLADDLMDAAMTKKKDRAAKRDMLASQIMLQGFLESDDRGEDLSALNA